MKARLGFKSIVVLAGVSFSAFAQLSSPQTVNFNGTSAIMQLGDANHYIKSVQGQGVKIGTYQYPDVINIMETNGRVGIGVMSPDAKLDVFTDASSSYAIRGVCLNTNTNGKAIFGSNYANNGTAVYGASNGGSGSIAVFGGASGGGFSGYFSGGIFSCMAPMGIGTTIPGSYQLAVEGKIGCRELVVTTVAWADHVLKPDYSLKPLNEVEKFIKTNNHLEGIPSEKEVKTNGVAIGDMQAKLLQKVEELTLYTIELNKKVERLSKDNVALQKKLSLN